MRFRSKTHILFLVLTVALAVVLSGCLNLFVPRKQAEGTIKGQLVFEYDTPIEGAEIVVSKVSKTTTTDSEGLFEITGVPYGFYTVSAKRDGEVVAQDNVHLNAEEVFVFLRDNGPNILENSWWEEIDESTGLPVGWTRFAGVINETMWITDEDAKEGKYSLKGYQAESKAVGIRSKRYPVQPGETYQLTAWVRTIDIDPEELAPGDAWKAARAWIGIETWPNETTTASTDRNWTHVNAPAEAWTQLIVTHTVPEGHYWIDAFLFTFQNDTRGTFYWNAPRLVKIEE